MVGWNYLRIEVDDKRVFGLDLLRAIAIFCVLQGHAERMLFDTALDCFTDLPLPHGVDIFFILSGFLIGKSFISYLEKHQNTLGSAKILTFYVRTALRILPNYLFLLLVNYLLVRYQVISGNLETFPMWRFATFTQNLLTPFWDFYWESWSLPVQWWFYLFFPLLLVVFSRLSKPKKYIPWLCLCFIALSIAYRLVVADRVNDAFAWDIWMRKTVASRTENIYFGVLAAWLMCYFPKQWDRYAVASFIVGFVMFAVVKGSPRIIGSFYYNALYLTLSALAIALWVPLFTRWKTSKTAIGRFVTKASILSYSMFLTNLCLIVVVYMVFPVWMGEHGILAYFLFWPLVWVISQVLHLLLEKPFMRLRERVRI